MADADWSNYPREVIVVPAVTSFTAVLATLNIVIGGLVQEEAETPPPKHVWG